MKIANAIKSLESKGYSITKVLGREEYYARASNASQITFYGDSKGEVNTIRVGIRNFSSLKQAVERSMGL